MQTTSMYGEIAGDILETVSKGGPPPFESNRMPTCFAIKINLLLYIKLYTATGSESFFE